MINHIVDISEDNRHISVNRGFMVIRDKEDVVGHVPFDMISAVIITARAVSYTNSFLAKLSDLGVPLVVCGNNLSPVGILVGLNNHFRQTGRLHQQLDVTKPFLKNLWQSIIIAKIINQSCVLKRAGFDYSDLELMAKRVGSGDPENVEAQAARLYWKRLFGRDFRRDYSQVGLNSLLNYGYAILRGCLARYVVASGLNPSLGIFHESKVNPLCLVDDVIEPFRSFIDLKVYELSRHKLNEGEVTAGVSKEAKKYLVNVLSENVTIGTESTSLQSSVQKMIWSLVSSYESKKNNLLVPKFSEENEK